MRGNGVAQGRFAGRRAVAERERQRALHRTFECAPPGGQRKAVQSGRAGRQRQRAIHVGARRLEFADASRVGHFWRGGSRGRLGARRAARERGHARALFVGDHIADRRQVLIRDDDGVARHAHFRRQ